MKLALFLRVLIPLLFASQLAAADPVLDTVAKVRALSPEKAARELPVRIEATVLYFDRESGDLFVADETAATYVASSGTGPGRSFVREFYPRPLNPGDRVRIEGKTRPGGYFPDVVQQRVLVLGKRALPEARRIGDDEMLSPALDSQWVEVGAVVTGVESAGLAFTLAIEVHGWKLKVEIPPDEHSAERAEALMQRPVFLRGCVGTVFNTQRQMTGRFFYVPSFNQIIPTDTPGGAVQPPLRTVIELLRKDDTEHTLVRVQGVVTHARDNEFCLRDASGSVLVYTARSGSFVPGARVDAEGFAAMAPFRPIFRARRVSVLGGTEHPLPMMLHFESGWLTDSNAPDRRNSERNSKGSKPPPAGKPLSQSAIQDFERKKRSLYQAELVTLDAEYLARHDGPIEIVLQCRSVDRFFEAVAPPSAALPEKLGLGDVVRLTGICELTTTHPTPRVEWVDGFRLHLSKEGGITLLQPAPWWTLRRLLIAFGIVSVVALMALAWVWLLRRRVAAQTEIIFTQREREAVHEERQRIARELHDSVEQELAGVSMQLGNISGDIRRMTARIPPEFSASIQIAQKMLHHCQEEAHTAIQDLRNVDLEQLGLPDALRKLLSRTAGGFGAAFQMNVTGKPRTMAGIAETHLLRIAQEGVANAAHHAAAGQITVDLDYTSDAVALAIRDNGHGFDPAVPPPDGHFGLRGIRERSNKIRAALDVQSAPGKGTAIRVVVPLSGNHRPS